MFNEKLKYYRKKNLMSQEDLAAHLNVSRQMVTKWESGIVIPGIEYLIDISKLFGVTIDSLIKDDDCLTFKENPNETNDLAYFLVTAKKETYANKKGKIKSSRSSSHDYLYTEDKYKYLDSFVGASKFSGEEVVYDNDLPIWSMNYYGRVLDKRFDGDFLKAALKQVPINKPFRGPERFSKGDFHYYNTVEGKIEFFYGKEVIFYQETKIYECLYHGGMIE